ncbi:MAG TPA: cobalamin-binding protein [Candidatus Binataceae bacterium]|nr:cobalamin-binding protein [Candidatus Binataceae bacterium]
MTSRLTIQDLLYVLRMRLVRATVIAVFTLLSAFAQTMPARAWPGQRIVSLAPSVTETLFAIGAGSEVVGVSQYCDYPPAVLKLPKVGSFLTPNLEAIVGLRPGLIIGLETSANEREIRALQRMGYRVVLTNDDSLAGIEDGINTIGQRTGHVGQALVLLNSLHARAREVKERLKGIPPRKVLVVVGHDPLVAVGGGYLDQLLRIADCVNIAAGLGVEWPRVSLEYVIATAPDVILDGQMGSERAAPSGFWSRYPTIPAVSNHRVYAYDQNEVLRPGPRVGQTLATLEALTHPEVFPGAHPIPAPSSSPASTRTAEPR